MDSRYDDLKWAAREAAAGRHREAVGGRWEEIGRLQFEFLVAEGLRPEHELLDIGCGALRGGLHFVRHLAAGNYCGVDISEELLDAGYEQEIRPAGLADRLPRGNLVRDGDFDLGALGRSFDFAVAQSLFTHLNFNRIRRCILRAAQILRPGGALYATYFEAPPDHPLDTPLAQPHGAVTSDVADPFHYREDDLRHAARDAPLRFERLGDWGHPRDQRMARFVRL